MIFNLLCWLTSSEVIDAVLKILMLLATCGLIAVAIFQARAAATQAKAAKRQVKAARDQIAASKANLKEVLSQGIASRRPFFVIEPGETLGGRTTARLKNVGPGIAFKTTWQFKSFSGNPYVVHEEIGAIGVGITIPMLYTALDKRQYLDLEQISKIGGEIGIKYQDSTGQRYWTKVTRAPEGHLTLDTGDDEQD